jgi:hypothetical protein
MRTVVCQRMKKCLDFLMDAQVVAVSLSLFLPSLVILWFVMLWSDVRGHPRTNELNCFHLQAWQIPAMKKQAVCFFADLIPISRTPRCHNSENSNTNFDLLQDIKVLLYYVLDESSFRHTETGKLRPRLSAQVFFKMCFNLSFPQCQLSKVLSFPPGFRIKIFCAFLRLDTVVMTSFNQFIWYYIFPAWYTPCYLDLDYLNQC